jgi:hypothetical protein
MYTLAEIRNGTGFPSDARFTLVSAIPVLPSPGGSGKDELMRQRREARAVLREGLEKLAAMRPHGRDYTSDAEWQTARAHHEESIRAVQAVIERLESEARTIGAWIR